MPPCRPCAEARDCALDALNLNDPKLKYYALSRDQPRSFYDNGRQYYFTIHAKW